MNDYLTKFKNDFVGIEEIFLFAKANETEKDAIRKALTRFVDKGEIFRAGRGVYGFFCKSVYTPKLNEQTKRLSEILIENFPYLDFTITDTSFFAEFMNLQPFATVLLIETKESAIIPIISNFQKQNINSYAQKDYPKIERYIKSDVLILLRAYFASNPNPIKCGKVKYASLEKILVDLVCDTDIFGQYQASELENIYQNAIAKYAVNYSKLLKYAKARNRKSECISLLETTEEYLKVKNLL